MSSSRIENLVQQSFDEFYRQRLMKLTGVMPSDLLRKKNLHLLCATSDASVSKIVQKLLEEYLSSEDENIFGDTFFESIASLEREGTALSGEKSHIAFQSIALINLMRKNTTQVRIEYEKERDNATNRLTYDFLNNFGNPDGSIDWEKLLRFNSGKDKVPWISKLMPVISTEDQDNDSDDTDDIDLDEETLDE